MTRDDILRMAREAGLIKDWMVLRNEDSDALARFAALVAAAERTRACRIVTGLCISDNNAREICQAIRAEEPDDGNPSF